VAVLATRVNGKAMNIGLLTGVVVNMFLWIIVPNVFWFWWNFIGCLVSFGVAYAASYFIKNTDDQSLFFDRKIEPILTKYNIILAIVFVAILLFCINLPSFI
jgi:hypothetical protein